MIKKDKHGKHCHNQRKHITPFVISVESMLGREALLKLSQLSQFMAYKREEPLLQVQGWLNSRIAIAVARFYSQMIHVARLHGPRQEREPDWDPESGIGLAD